MINIQPSTLWPTRGHFTTTNTQPTYLQTPIPILYKRCRLLIWSAYLSYRLFLILWLQQEVPNQPIAATGNSFDDGASLGAAFSLHSIKQQHDITINLFFFGSANRNRQGWGTWERNPVAWDKSKTSKLVRIKFIRCKTNKQHGSSYIFARSCLSAVGSNSLSSSKSGIEAIRRHHPTNVYNLQNMQYAHRTQCTIIRRGNVSWFHIGQIMKYDNMWWMFPCLR